MHTRGNLISHMSSHAVIPMLAHLTLEELRSEPFDEIKLGLISKTHIAKWLVKIQRAPNIVIEILPEKQLESLLPHVAVFESKIKLHVKG